MATTTRHLVKVDLDARSYPIHIAPGILAEAGRLIRPHLKSNHVLVISDETVANLHGQAMLDSLKAGGFHPEISVFPPGEPSKNLETAGKLWEACAASRIDRGDAIIAFGGGVTGDLAGFVAACWMRGVTLVQIPTSLMAMVDSGVGGKTGVNSAAGKNLIGAFKQPVCVVIDPNLVATMPDREYRAGLAEVLKYGVIRDPAFLAWQEEHAEEMVNADPSSVAHAVAASCHLKAIYVVEDETEQGPRAQLNYGHTFAHAIERQTGYKTYLHGEAVGIGMRMSADLSQRLGVLTDPALAKRQDTLLQRYQLPLTHRCIDPVVTAHRLAEQCKLDKKTLAGQVRFVLPIQAGSVVVREVTDEAALEAAFLSALTEAGHFRA